MQSEVKTPCTAWRSAGVLGAALLAVAALSAGAAHCGAQNLGYSAEPTVTEYDVDPNWPQVPDHISRAGWVSGLAVDATDQVWFFRRGPDPVQVYHADGTFVRSWGKDQFISPHQLRIDHEGNVWVADFGAHVVQKYTPEGKLLMTLGVRGEAGTDATHFDKPTDMAVAENGDIFVTDGYGNRRIVQFDRHGTFLKAWGEYGTSPGKFVLPHALVLDRAGRIYVADRNSGRIQVFNAAGEFVDSWDNLLMPWGICLTSDDQLWVCGSSPHWWLRDGKYPEYKDQLLMRFSLDGRVRQVWSIPLGDIGDDKDHPDVSRLRPGEAVGVHCIDVDSQGNLYVGDIYGERAQKFIPIRQRTGAQE